MLPTTAQEAELLGEAGSVLAGRVRERRGTWARPGPGARSWSQEMFSGAANEPADVKRTWHWGYSSGSGSSWSRGPFAQFHTWWVEAEGWGRDPAKRWTSSISLGQTGQGWSQHLGNGPKAQLSRSKRHDRELGRISPGSSQGERNS